MLKPYDRTTIIIKLLMELQIMAYKQVCISDKPYEEFRCHKLNMTFRGLYCKTNKQSVYRSRRIRNSETSGLIYGTR